jgi:starch phosphorylase
VLSQRWLKTEQTYQQRSAKGVYYLSMEFLLGRALANNISNLLIDPEAQQFCQHHQLDPLQIIEQEPDARLGNGGLDRLAACFLDSMATLGIAGMGYGLRYDYGIFRQSIRAGWQIERPDHWLARPDPWEVARPNEAVEVKLNVSFEIRGGALRVVEGHRNLFLVDGVPTLDSQTTEAARFNDSANASVIAVS